MTYFYELMKSKTFREAFKKEWNKLEDEMDTKKYFMSLEEKRRLLCPRCDECGCKLGGKRHTQSFTEKGEFDGQWCCDCAELEITNTLCQEEAKK